MSDSISHLPLEPFKIKVVERISLPPRLVREHELEAAGYNLFNLRSDAVYIDLLTDSGTSAMSDEQWAAMMRGDESYAGSRNYYRLESTVQEITNYAHVIPTHQGRSAESLLFSTVLGPGMLVPNNMHFDTTRANVEANLGHAEDLLCPQGFDIESESPFKGDMDVERLDAFLTEHGTERVPLVMITVTCNSNGGQPVSMANVRDVRKVCDEHGVPLFFDACRFAENSFLVREREEGYGNRTVKEIAQELFSYGAGCTFSGKKDALVNMGGFLACNDDELARKLTEKLVLVEGFPTYGGLAGRDLEAMAQGLEEVLHEDYLAFRIGQIRTMSAALQEAGVPHIKPVGGHALYLDAKAFCPHIPPAQFPGQALSAALYLEAGIRSVEIGSLMFEQVDPETGETLHPELEMVRLAVPRRVYTTRHLLYVVDAIIKLYEKRDTIRGMEIVSAPPRLRHFTARLRPIP
jgi:tryptophanase